MVRTTTEQEITAAWQRLTDNKFPDAKRRNIKAELARSERQATTIANEHLEFWLALINEALHFLILLYDYTLESRRKSNKKTAPSFMVLLAHACSLTTAIRKLIVSGLESAARPITRSLLETLDLAIVTLVDEDFATLYMGDDDTFDENEFWKRYLAWGKMDDRIRRVLQTLDFDNEWQRAILDSRRTARRFLSAAVHPSATSAFISMFIPSIEKPGTVSMSILGSASAYAPGHLSFVITEIYHFGSIVLKLIMAEKPPLTFAEAVWSAEEESLFAVFLTYQEMIQRYSEKLPPPFSFPMDDLPESEI